MHMHMVGHVGIAAKQFILYRVRLASIYANMTHVCVASRSVLGTPMQLGLVYIPIWECMCATRKHFAALQLQTL